MTIQQTSMQQLDIFADSRDVMLRNDVLEPLQRRDAVPARTALERLAREYPDDGSLPAMTVMVRELEDGSTAPFVDHAALTLTRRHLEDDVVPAARRVLPAQAVQRWLAPCWRALSVLHRTLRSSLKPPGSVNNRRLLDIAVVSATSLKLQRQSES